ncbi:MAG: response regulator transcription factor [Chitinophagaceae bacterium]|jgi:DNA-binding NarL/FixJ family response regulator|nr:response regulator transcription factor [Chitinophagaceae bacterium]MBP6589873.1 response regulator transcription factor [Chitinophagaceae bacterium]
MIRVAVYDDNKARRESLQAFIAMSPELEEAGVYENCAGIQQHIQESKPDIILMDIEMPEVNGLEGVKQVKQQYPEIKIIMQTAFDDDDKIFAALQAGAEGYILKSASVIQIAQSIDDVMKGGAAMTPSIALKVMRYFGQQKTSSAVDYNLSPKENEVLKHLATGLSYKMIADQMGISYFTVNNHVKKIYEKLQVHSLGEAMALAHKEKLI